MKTINDVTIDIEQVDDATIKTIVRNDGATQLEVLSPQPSCFIQVDGDCVRFARIRFKEPEVRAHYLASPKVVTERIEPGKTLEDTISLTDLEERDEALARKLREKNHYKSSKDAREAVKVKRARFVVEVFWPEARGSEASGYQIGWKEIVLARPVNVQAYQRGWW